MSDKDNVISLSSLPETIHQGAQRLLFVTIKAEVQRFIDEHAEIADTQGQRLTVGPSAKIVLSSETDGVAT